MEIAIITVLAVTVIVLVFYLIKSRHDMGVRIRDARREAITQSRAVLGGRFTEQLAPYLPEFKYDPTEARFIGSPVDFIVFPGLSSDKPSEVVLLEVKSGKSGRLTHREKRIQELVEAGHVRWELIHRPAEI